MQQNSGLTPWHQPAHHYASFLFFFCQTEVFFCSERRLDGARQHATTCQSLHITAVIFRQLKTATRTTYHHRMSSITHSHMISVFLQNGTTFGWKRTSFLGDISLNRSSAFKKVWNQKPSMILTSDCFWHGDTWTKDPLCYLKLLSRLCLVMI